MIARTVHGPRGAVHARLPLGRGPHLLLVETARALDESAVLSPGDRAQIMRQLTGHARLVAVGVRRLCDRLPENSGIRALTEAVLSGSAGRPATPAALPERSHSPVATR